MNPAEVLLTSANAEDNETPGAPTAWIADYMSSLLEDEIEIRLTLEFEGAPDEDDWNDFLESTAAVAVQQEAIAAAERCITAEVLMACERLETRFRNRVRK